MIFGNQLLTRFLGVFRCLKFVSEDDIDCAVRAHHRNFSCRVTVIDVSPDMFARHYVISTTVAFPCNDRYLWDRRFTKCVKEFSPVSDDSSFLHINSGEETRDIHKGNQRDIKTIAETDKPARFYRRVGVE